MLGVGVAWQHPDNLAAVARLNIGGVQLGYAYQIFGLNRLLVQHEFGVKVRFAGKKEAER